MTHATKPRCAWCGKALAQRMNHRMRQLTASEAAQLPALLAQAEQARAEILAEYEASPTMQMEEAETRIHRAQERIRRSLRTEDGGEVVVSLYGVAGRIEQVRVSEPTGEFGYYGEGIFCSLRHGFEFGTAAYRNGQRMRIVK